MPMRPEQLLSGSRALLRDHREGFRLSKGIKEIQPFPLIIHIRQTVW